MKISPICLVALYGEQVTRLVEWLFHFVFPYNIGMSVSYSILINVVFLEVHRNTVKDKCSNLAGNGKAQ